MQYVSVKPAKLSRRASALAIEGGNEVQRENYLIIYYDFYSGPDKKSSAIPAILVGLFSQ